jgi:transcriptional regulator with XRE-family HTH domain
VRQGQTINPGDQWIGNTLREARLAASLTQQELARRLGWSPDTLASYETGRRGLRASQLAEIAKVLDLPAAALLLDVREAASVLQRLGDNVERWNQVALFLDALDRQP